MIYRTFITRAAVGLGILIGMLLQPALRAQGLDPRTSGSTYVIAFPDTTRNTFDSRFPNKIADTIALFIYSAVDNDVHITSPNGYDNYLLPRGGKFEVVYLNALGKRAKAPIADTAGVESWNTFRIEAAHPIILYCYVVTKFGGEAFTPLPVESWGREYFAAGHPGEVAVDISPGGETTYQSKNKMAPAELLITAAFDNTIVEIYPSAKTTFANYPRLTVTLKANQCYLLETLVDSAKANQWGEQPEIAGTRIVASRPISVISGNTRAQLNASSIEKAGLGRNSFKNLMIEALAPIEQHGREFVYLPTWDTTRMTGEPGEKIETKRTGELVRIYGEDSSMTTVTHHSGGGTVAFADVYQDRIEGPTQARVYHTNNPSQAFLGCMATVIYKGTTGGVGFLGASYEAYSPYMVELVAREQWTSFAPYFAPPHPSSMKHFVNIVADTVSAQRIFNELGMSVVFNHGAIPGTDLVWGSMSVTPGVDHYFVGRDGARFYAVAYGLWKGYELYRPGRAEKKGDDQELAGGGGEDDNHLLHPSEYEENTAVSYGYPLAPGRVSLSAGDSLVIKTTLECALLHVTVESVNAKPVGLRSISLDSVSTGSDLSAASPNWQTELIGATETAFDVVLRNNVPTDSGSVIIQDRSGKIYRVPFNFSEDHIRFNEGTLLRLDTTRATNSRDTVVYIANASLKPLPVKSLRLGGSRSGFSIVGATSSFPTTIPAEGSILVRLRFDPPAANQTFRDTLTATSDCGEIRLALVVESVLPSGLPDAPRAGYAIGSVRPSPTKERAVISFRLGHPGDLTLELYDIQGNLVQELVRSGLDEGEGSETIDVSNVPVGNYLLRLSSGEWSATTVVVVVR